MAFKFLGQRQLGKLPSRWVSTILMVAISGGAYDHDHLTDFLEEVKGKADFHYWLFGHYHDNRILDGRFVLLWEQIVKVL